MSTTLQTVLDRITQDYLNRPDLTNQATRAVQAAVRHYERQRFHWNETVTTLTAIPSQSNLSVPADFLVLDLLQVQFQSSNYNLGELSFAEIKLMNTAPGNSSTNLPDYFAIYANAFEFFPIPDSAYLLNCYYLKQLPALSATTDTNKWLSAAENLITYHATKIMWANVLRNSQEAQVYAALERDAASTLYEARDQRVINKIRATRF